MISLLELTKMTPQMECIACEVAELCKSLAMNRQVDLDIQAEVHSPGSELAEGEMRFILTVRTGD